MNQSACLELFNCVASDLPHTKHLVGQAVTDIPASMDKWVNLYLVSSKLSFDQLNAGFYKDWRKRSDMQRLVDQFFHYVTVAISDINPGLMDVYVPEGQAVPSGKYKVIAIGTITEKEAIQRSIDLLNRNALTQEQITKILSIIGDENLRGLLVRNREAQCIIWDKTGELPSDGDELLRYFVYKSTGKTLVINNPITIAAIRASGYMLPNLNVKQLASIAERFLPHKNLWLAFKHANRANITLVNRMRRMATLYHKPVRPTLFSQMTANPKLNTKALAAIVEQKSMSEIAKVVNVLRAYAGSENRVYKIRNGKSYWKTDKAVDNTKYIPILTDALRRKAGNVSIRQPAHVEYAFPVSKKQYIGNIPMGTYINLPHSGKVLKIGIHWFDQNGRCDLDMRADSIGGSVGWNASYRANGIMFSGDITAAPKPNGASEYLTLSREVDDVYVLKVNSFTHQVPFDFKFIIGFGTTAKENLIDLDEILFELPITANSKEYTIGLLVVRNNVKRFYLYGGETGVRHVGSGADVQLKSMFNNLTNSLKLSDVFEKNINGIDLTNPAIDTFDFCL